MKIRHQLLALAGVTGSLLSATLDANAQLFEYVGHADPAHNAHLIAENLWAPPVTNTNDQIISILPTGTIIISHFIASINGFSNENPIQVAGATDHQVVEIGGPVTITDGAIPDIIVASPSLGTVRVISHFGDMDAFLNQVVIEDYSTPSLIRGALLDDDELQDVLLIHQNNMRIGWARNALTSESQWMSYDLEPAPEIWHNTSANLVDLECGDLDLDGDVDFVVADLNAGIRVFNNTGNAVFSPTLLTSLPSNIDQIELADADGDGDLDLFIMPNEGGSLSWCENLGSEGFAPTASLISDTFAWGEFALSDLNEDGRTDVALLSASDRKVQVFLNYDQGNTWNLHDIPMTFTQNNGVLVDHFPVDIALGDIDGDGRQDLTVSDAQSGYEVLFFRNTGPIGCTQPSACNYDPIAVIESGMCCFGICGCIHAPASNYNPDADCNDGSCTYLEHLSVFHDVNANGVWDDDEYALPNMEIEYLEAGVTLTSSGEGTMTYELPIGTHTFSVSGSQAFPYITTENPVEHILPMHVYWDVEFGVSATTPEYDLDVHILPTGPDLCNANQLHTIHVENEGNGIVDAVVAFSFDALFQDYTEGSPIDSTLNDTLYFSVDQMFPGQTAEFDLYLRTPTVEFIGEPLSAHAEVFGYAYDALVDTDDYTLEGEVSCAYDPNDKQVFPNGYTAEHRVLNDRLEYLVRFQNTGNAPAQDVTIRDTLAWAFIPGSFRVEAASHDLVTSLDDVSREVVFSFNNIQLPDSTCCEEESHGYVLFSADLYGSVSHGTVIENTAYIYFDNNPPIVTNTTWSTIHECTPALNIALTEGDGCPLNWVELEADYDTSIPWDYAVEWTLDDTSFASTLHTLLVPPAENAVVQVTVNDPLCTETGSLSVDLGPRIWTTCVGDLDCDGTVDTRDLLSILGEVECAGLACLYDVNDDGETSVGDVLVVLGAFASTCD